MSTLCLTLREEPPQRVDMSPLTTDRLAGKQRDQIAAVELASGNRRVRVDSLFDVSGSFASDLEILGSTSRLDRIGEGMTRGRITVRGEVGAFLGAGMLGGIIEVHGHAGAYAAAGMRGGFLHVRGNAGDFLAGAVAGDRHGMQGGTVVVSGEVGDRTGDRMRRGTVLIDGPAGDYCASRMIAGTIGVAGRIGKHPGLAMRRGTLLLLEPPPGLLPTFNDCGEYQLNILPLLVKSWRPLPSRFAALPETGLRVRRYMGDLANDGRGEILIRA